MRTNVARWAVALAFGGTLALSIQSCGKEGDTGAGPTGSTGAADATSTGTGGHGGTGGAGGAGGHGGTGGASASSAQATVEPKSGSTTKGTATFTQSDGKVTFTLTVEGVNPGEHAVHIHDMGNCGGDDAMSAGGHWNPTMKDHGKWGTDPFHLGDIGNMTVDAQGNGTISLTTDRWALGTGAENDVVGHALMVHESPDDFATQPTGNAGARIGCGVIELKQ